MWIIDFESSGLHRSSYPIEVGLTNGIIEYQALIQPMGHWQFWSGESEKIHRISRQTLIEQGIQADDVANHLNRTLSGQLVYCDAIAWDRFWARIIFSDTGIHQRFELCEISTLFDTEREIAMFLQEKERLVSTGHYQLHRAMDDARIIYQALMHVIGGKQKG